MIEVTERRVEPSVRIIGATERMIAASGLTELPTAPILLLMAGYYFVVT